MWGGAERVGKLCARFTAQCDRAGTAAAASAKPTTKPAPLRRIAHQSASSRPMSLPLKDAYEPSGSASAAARRSASGSLASTTRAPAAAAACFARRRGGQGGGGEREGMCAREKRHGRREPDTASAAGALRPFPPPPPSPLFTFPRAPVSNASAHTPRPSSGLGGLAPSEVKSGSGAACCRTTMGGGSPNVANARSTASRPTPCCVWGER